MEKIRNLLNQVGIINKKNLEILDATGGRFNMFRLCGVNHYENTHSAIIAEFLNPKGTHGLKSKLLECFIETLGDYFTIKNFNCLEAKVYTEFSTEEGRIDIFIRDNQNNAIIIENKVYASDQSEQLKRYNRYAQKSTSDYQILYLSLFGNNASEQSGDGVTYLPISYEDNIIDWLEKCVAIASRLPIVRETLIQYISHLKQLTDQDMNTKNQEEIAEFISKIDNLRAAKTVYQNYSAALNYIIEKHFNPKMIEFAKQKGIEYKYEQCEEWYIRFNFTNSNWQGKYWIGFTIDKGQYFYGICNNPKAYRVSDENRRGINEKLSEIGIHNGRQTDWWPFLANIPNLSLDVWENDIINSDNFVKNCQKKVEELLQVIEKMEL